MKKDENISNASALSYLIGLFLLIPPIIGVLLFLVTLLFDSVSVLNDFDYGSFWSGSRGDDGGWSSPMPIYLGLMAIAGAYLIKE